MTVNKVKSYYSTTLLIDKRSEDRSLMVSILVNW